MSHQPTGPTALVDHWYSHAVGHVIEALRRCQGYHACDPTLWIGLVLNAASPLELVRCAPFAVETFSVPYHELRPTGGEPEACPRAGSRGLGLRPPPPSAATRAQTHFEGLRRYFEASARHFHARIAVGIAGQPRRRTRPSAAPARPAGRAETRHVAAGVTNVDQGDASRAAPPPLPVPGRVWTLVLDELERRFPDVAFTFVGRLRSGGGRTISGITRGEVDRLVASRRHAIDVFDRPILDQLASIEASSPLRLSPHGLRACRGGGGYALARALGR